MYPTRGTMPLRSGVSLSGATVSDARDDLPDWTALGARLLRPDRPRLAEARAAVAGVTDVAEAWARLRAAGMIPPRAVTSRGVYRDVAVDPARRWRPYGTRVDGDGDALPDTLDEAVTLAADPDGMARAARLACALAPDASARWRVHVAGARVVTAPTARAIEAVERRAEVRLDATPEMAALLASRPRAWPWLLPLARVAVAARYVDADDALATTLRACAAVLALGYAVERVTPDEVVLVTPSL